jgi:hypothetical protein
MLVDGEVVPPDRKSPANWKVKSRFPSSLFAI